MHPAGIRSRRVCARPDELYRDSNVSDRTWATLAARFDTRMMVDALITASNYRMVSMALNALGVQIDPDERERFPRVPSRQE